MCAVSASCHFRDDDYVTCMDHSPVHSALDLRLIKMNFSLHCWLRHTFTKCPRSLHQSCLWSREFDLNYPRKYLFIFWHYSAIFDISVPVGSFESNTMFSHLALVGHWSCNRPCRWQIKQHDHWIFPRKSALHARHAIPSASTTYPKLICLCSSFSFLCTVSQFRG